MRLCHHYHRHMGTCMMMRPDVDRLMDSTDPELVDLLLDTAHLAFAGDDPLALTQSHGERIKHVHRKDIRTEVVDRLARRGWSFPDAIEAGVFTVPGDGAIDFAPIFDAKARAYLREVLGW